jgi:hypothetical protein
MLMKGLRRNDDAMKSCSLYHSNCSVEYAIKFLNPDPFQRTPKYHPAGN